MGSVPVSLYRHPREAVKERGKTLCRFCERCSSTRLAKRDGPINNRTNAPLFFQGDFIIDCDGIPAESSFVPNEEHVFKQLSGQLGRALVQKEIDDIRMSYDVILWAKKHLDWDPRISYDGDPYQENILQCSAKRKVLRCGRRLGKSEILVIYVLYKLFTNSPNVKRYNSVTQKMERGFSSILFIAPFLSQVKDFFNRLRKMVASNPMLSREVLTDVSTPYFRMELKSGMILSGFSAGSSGASSVRGQKGDIIVLDEMDYLDQESIDTVVALLMEHADVELIAASTPSGRREYFYDWCMNDMTFKEFYYPSMCNPNWGPKMEAEMRALYRTEIAWKHEIEADFGESETSVFQYKYLEKAMQKYDYESCTRKDGAVYSIGCDWNDSENGTKIRVLEFDPDQRIIRAVDLDSVEKSGWTQSAAIESIIKMNRKWKADYVYVDSGYGAMQIEHLRKFGHEARLRKDQWALTDMTLMSTKGVNFSSKHETFDPISGLPEKQPMKPFMVESCVRKFEAESIKFSMSDEILLKQLHGYHVERISSNGTPVYASGPAGDHDLDAFMLGVLAFEIELSEFSNPKYNSHITFSGKMGENKSEIKTNEILSHFGVSQKEPPSTKPNTRDISSVNPYSGFTSLGSRIYTRDAFSNDEYVPRRSTGVMAGGRGRMPISRAIH